MFNKKSDNQSEKSSAQERASFTATEGGELTENSAKRYFSFLGFTVLLVFIIQALIQFILLLITPIIFPKAEGNAYVSFLIAFVPLYFIAMPIGAVLLKRLPHAKPLKSNVSVKHWLGGLCVAFALMLLGNYISQIFTAFFETVRGSAMKNPVSESTQSTPFILTLIFTVIVAPVAEELFFRKLLCDRLLPLGDGYAIFVSSAIFALAHGNFFQLFYAFFLGCFFSIIYVNTGKLKHSIIYHMLINFVGTVVVSWITSAVDLNALLENGITLDSFKQNPLPLIAFFSYDLLMIAFSFIGVILIFNNYKKITLREGIIPPPKKSRISCIFMNFGVACAIAYFALSLVMSIAF